MRVWWINTDRTIRYSSRRRGSYEERGAVVEKLSVYEDGMLDGRRSC